MIIDLMTPALHHEIPQPPSLTSIITITIIVVTIITITTIIFITKEIGGLLTTVIILLHFYTVPGPLCLRLLPHLPDQGCPLRLRLLPHLPDQG